jgi:two-component system, LytTR family, sensor kinase
MRRSFSLNNYFFQFILFIILNTSFGILAFLVMKNLNFQSPDPSQPLGAPDSFILYNNFIKALLAVIVIAFYRNLPMNTLTNPFLRYGLLAVIIYFANGIVQELMRSRMDDQIVFTNVLWNPGGSIVFRAIMILSTLLIYRWAMWEERRESESLSRKLEISTLRELMTKAELEALQSKVDPHFLYNSLNSIHTLVDQEPAKAQKMIIQLSKLFRLSVNKRSDFYCSLREELELVSTYLSIEKVRFGERLKFEIRCADNLMSEIIPRWLLQPLVENAIKHGTSKISGEGHVEIVIQENSNYIEMQVRDNGPAFQTDLQQGYGLRAVYEKIKLLGGEGACIEIIGSDRQVPPIAGPWKYVEIKLRKRESIDR